MQFNPVYIAAISFFIVFIINNNLPHIHVQ